MSAKKTKKIYQNFGEIKGGESGASMYLRPFLADEKAIAEIARACGEKKSAVAQKLLHLALHGGQVAAPPEKRQAELLQWLINREKHKELKAEARDLRLERLEAHARELETILQKTAEQTRQTRILTGEIYGVTTACLSYLNRIFTKFVEYFAPTESERQSSAKIADENILALIEHALGELDRLTAHYELDETEDFVSARLYLATKIEKIKMRLLAPPNSPTTG